MEITVSKRFLRVPVKFDGTSHKFTFSENGTPVYKFDAVYTEENADAVYYADLRDYLGKTMTVTVEPECTFTPVFEDAAALYSGARLDQRSERSVLLRRTVSPFLPAQSLRQTVGQHALGSRREPGSSPLGI